MAAKVLIVEDEALLALALADILVVAGFEIIGPASTVDHALQLIKTNQCHIAVLDVNLRDETSEPIARELQGRRTPHVFLSGIATGQLPAWFNGSILLSKPVRATDLIGALHRSLGSVRN